MNDQTIYIEGMTCQACPALIQNQFEKDPRILNAKVDLDTGLAQLEVEEQMAVEALQEILGKESKYSIRSSDQDPSVQKPNAWSTYKPIALIFFFVLGISLITSFEDGSFQLQLVMRHFMAGFFLVFSFFKFLDIKGFARSYAGYDLLAMRWPAYGIIYPFIELGLGLSFLTGQFFPQILWITIAVMGFSSLGVIRSVVNRQKIRCACLGTVFNLPMSTVTIIEDVLMVIMAGVMLFLS